MLHIFPTSRMVREFYASFGDNSLLPQATDIRSFEEKILLVPDLIRASDDTRVLLMHEACKFENFKKLHILDEFLSFLNNSSYLFRFFEELAIEQKSCIDLQNADTYAEYNEHLEILQTLHEKYTTLLAQKGYYDSITLPKLYKLNSDFIERFDKISLHVEGFLNNFEWDLFVKIAQIIEVEIYLHVTPYNQKMRELFLDFGIKLPSEGSVRVDLNSKSFELLKTTETKPTILNKSFPLRSLQIGYIYEQISNFVNRGLSPEEIVVILPDESFAPLLKAYDKSNNLNFAMGFSFATCKIYQKLNAINEAIKEDNPCTRAIIDRFNLHNSLIEFKNAWSNETNFEDFKELINSLELEFSTQTKTQFENELYSISIILGQIKLKLSQLFKLFLQRLQKLSIDDTKGGKVVVMGLLETRGINYKGVIIPDFNDEFVPRFSQKDMFLSSKLRVHAGLPSLKDRENLQRYFYHQIINNAHFVSLSYVQNDTSMVSRFMQNLNTNPDNSFTPNSYASLLFSPKEQKPIFTCKELIRQNDIFDKPISSSRLKLFLTCKRGYYYRYIQGLKDEDLPSDELDYNHIGNFLHKCLEQVYKTKRFSDAKSLHVALQESLYQIHHKRALWLLEREVWQRRLLGFCENEIRRFDDGWSPYEFEKELTCEFNGVRLHGFIDRIDKHVNGEFCVLDYKSGKIDMKNAQKTEDFQLQFYYLLAKSRYKNIKNAGFYDLNGSQIIWDDEMSEKIDRLGEIISEIKSQKEINYTIEEKDCTYSPYTILLGRE